MPRWLQRRMQELPGVGFALVGPPKTWRSLLALSPANGDSLNGPNPVSLALVGTTNRLSRDRVSPDVVAVFLVGMPCQSMRSAPEPSISDVDPKADDERAGVLARIRASRVRSRRAA